MLEVLDVNSHRQEVSLLDYILKWHQTSRKTKNLLFPILFHFFFLHLHQVSKSHPALLRSVTQSKPKRARNTPIQRLDANPVRTKTERKHFSAMAGESSPPRWAILSHEPGQIHQQKKKELKASTSKHILMPPSHRRLQQSLHYEPLGIIYFHFFCRNLLDIRVSTCIENICMCVKKVQRVTFIKKLQVIFY